jgi:uncharacterized protein YndB with AHSA1/START domain
MSGITFTVEPTRQEMTMTQVFDAPRELVWRCHTDAELIPRWWGPRYLTTTIEHLDVRSGGSWRFLQKAPDGREFAFHGVYHLVEAPERSVGTFEFEGVPGHVAMETTVFEDLGDGRTRVTTTSVFQTMEDRDMMVASGAESGVREGHERMNELLAELLEKQPANH